MRRKCPERTFEKSIKLRKMEKIKANKSKIKEKACSFPLMTLHKNG
jgi:hypothetical protein